MDKKSQGLPMSFIVLAAISALILVLIVFFVTGAGGKLMGAIAGAQETDKTTAISLCQSLCEQARLSTVESQFTSSGFCTKRFSIAQADGTKKIVKCFDADIGLDCEVGIGDKTCKVNAAKTTCECKVPPAAAAT